MLQRPARFSPPEHVCFDHRPVICYALCALAIASQTIPGWLPMAAWAYVGLRSVHTLIQCSYNRVMHRLLVFMASFLLLFAMGIGFALSVY